MITSQAWNVPFAPTICVVIFHFSHKKKINTVIRALCINIHTRAISAIVWSIQKCRTDKNTRKSWNKILNIVPVNDCVKRCFTAEKNNDVSPFFEMKKFVYIALQFYLYFAIYFALIFLCVTLSLFNVHMLWYLLFDCRIEQNECWYTEWHECKGINSRLPKCQRSTNGRSHTQNCTK